MLAIVGGLYAISALAILVWFLIDAWRAASLVDRFMQFVLLASGAWGLWLALNARDNLRRHFPQRSSARR